MKQRPAAIFASASFAVVLILLGGSMLVRGAPSAARKALAQATATLPSELPPNTVTLVLDKTVSETLDPSIPGRYYKFEGKAKQLIRISLDPKSSNFYSTITILDSDLQTILGGTQGEAVIGGSVVVKLPDDGTYVVVVDYADSTIGTPTPGSYDLTLSEFKTK